MSYKVLIVDDSKLARMAVARALKALHPDWTAAEAANADEAMAQIQQVSPDFVLLDFNMPGKDGLVLAGELREKNPGINIAVISANHQVEVVSRAQAVGAAFLPKPLTEKALGEYFDACVKAGKVTAR